MHTAARSALAIMSYHEPVSIMAMPHDWAVKVPHMLQGRGPCWPLSDVREKRGGAGAEQTYLGPTTANAARWMRSQALA